jgi:histidine ammonia-lyase
MRDGKRSWVALVLASLFFVGIASGCGVSVGSGEGGPLAARAGYTPTSGQADPVLDGHSLTIAQVISVARGAPISIPAAVMDRVDRSFQLLLEAAKEDKPIYGLTRGVGENKDKTIFQGGKLDEHARRLSEDFNANLLRVQSTAVGPPVSREIVRAAM